MASLGGLDVAYGASMQIVRTNVLCMKHNENAGSEDATLASMQKVHNLAVQRFPSQLKPDYTWWFNANATHGSALATQTTSMLGGILGQDGVAIADPLVDHVQNTGNGNSISSVPVGGELTRGATGSGVRGLSVEAILSAGAVQIVAGNSTSEDLFAGTVTNDGAGEDPVVTSLNSASTMHSNLMRRVIDRDTTGEAVHPVTSTLSFLPLLNDLTFAGSVTEAEASGLTDGSETADTAASSLSALKTALGGGAAVLSVISLCKVA